MNDLDPILTFSSYLKEPSYDDLAREEVLNSKELNQLHKEIKADTIAYQMVIDEESTPLRMIQADKFSILADLKKAWAKFKKASPSKRQVIMKTQIEKLQSRLEETITEEREVAKTTFADYDNNVVSMCSA